MPPSSTEAVSVGISVKSTAVCNVDYSYRITGSSWNYHFCSCSTPSSSQCFAAFFEFILLTTLMHTKGFLPGVAVLILLISWLCSVLFPSVWLCWILNCSSLHLRRICEIIFGFLKWSGLHLAGVWNLATHFVAVFSHSHCNIFILQQFSVELDYKEGAIRWVLNHGESPYATPSKSMKNYIELVDWVARPYPSNSDVTHTQSVARFLQAWLGTGRHLARRELFPAKCRHQIEHPLRSWSTVEESLGKNSLLHFSHAPIIQNTGSRQIPRKQPCRGRA